MATAVGKIKFRHQTAIANNPAYDVSANVFNDSFVTGADVATDLGVDGDVMVRDSAQADGWGWQTVAGLVTPVTPAEGGTGIVSYTAGDMLYASGTTTLAKLAIVAAGQVLVSGTSPAWSANPSLTSVTLSSFVQTPTITRGADSTLSIQVNSAARWAFDNSTGAGSGGVYSLYPAVDATYDLGSATNRVGTGYFGTSIATPVLRSLSGNLNLRAAGATAIVFNVNSSDVMTFNGVGLTPTDATVALGDGTHRFTNGYFSLALIVGSNSATTGSLRMPSGATGIVFRNNANNADLAAMGSNASDVLTIGGNYVTTQIGSGGTFIGIGGLTSSFAALQRNGAGLNVRLADDSGYASLTAGSIFAAAAFFGPGTYATSGDWRAQSGFSFAYRNSANSANVLILSSDSSDRALFGDPGNGVMGVLYGSRIGFGGTTASFPALKRDTIFMQLRLADDSGVSGAITASLPVAAAARDGIIGFDTTLNALVYYVGGARFKLVGASF